jgi:hypothetical protein
VGSKSSWHKSARRGVYLDMRRRWRVILPTCGLLLFTWSTYQYFRFDHESHKGPWRYFYWSSIRLDSDPRGVHPKFVTRPCPNDPQNCLEFDPEFIWITPGPLTRLLELSALPAFLVGAIVVGSLARFGISEVRSFMVLMPLLILAWFYFLGWLLDRWRYKRSIAS